MQTASTRCPTRLRSSVATLLVLFGVSTAVVADKASDVAALEAQCEQEREAKIKPIRDEQIADCKATHPNVDPGYCERYWKNFGVARRGPNGTFIPRMFNDLPVCLAALKARRELTQTGNSD
jgi:hypothetical protein